MEVGSAEPGVLRARRLTAKHFKSTNAMDRMEAHRSNMWPILEVWLAGNYFTKSFRVQLTLLYRHTNLYEDVIHIGQELYHVAVS